MFKNESKTKQNKTKQKQNRNKDKTIRNRQTNKQTKTKQKTKTNKNKTKQKTEKNYILTNIISILKDIYVAKTIKCQTVIFTTTCKGTKIR